MAARLDKAMRIARWWKLSGCDAVKGENREEFVVNEEANGEKPLYADLCGFGTMTWIA